MSDQPDLTNQPAVQPPTAPPIMPPTPTTDPYRSQSTNGLAIAAMVVGIFAFILGWVPFIGLLLGATAVVLAIVGLKKTAGKGMSIAGLVTGGLAVLWNLVVIVLLVSSLAIFGGIASQIGLNINSYTAEQQAKLDAKKDFAKGETAVFDKFEVKANLTQRNYKPNMPEDLSSPTADNSKELVIVNVNIKNISQATASLTASDLKLNVNGVLASWSDFTVDPVFTGGSLSKGASYTGNLVYEIDKGATNLKLQYDEPFYITTNPKINSLTYTLKI